MYELCSHWLNLTSFSQDQKCEVLSENGTHQQLSDNITCKSVDTFVELKDEHIKIVCT